MASTSPTNTPESPGLNIIAHPQLLQKLSEVFASYGPSDLTVRTSDGGEFYVHKKIVCEMCEFFDKAVNGPFKEAKSGIIDMPNDPPAAVTALLEFVYEGYYTRLPVGTMLHCHFDLHVYILGVIYDMRPLREHAEAAFKSTFLGLESEALKETGTAISLLCKSTPHTNIPLTQFLVKYSADNYVALLRDEQFLEAMLHFEDFRNDIAKELAARANDLHHHVEELEAELFDGDDDSTSARCPNDACAAYIVLYDCTSKVYCIWCRTFHDRDDLEEIDE